MAGLCKRWGLSPSCLYAWQQAFLLHGLASLVYRHRGGRPPQLPPQQKKRLVELLEAGPLVVGWETACGNSGDFRERFYYDKVSVPICAWDMGSPHSVGRLYCGHARLDTGISSASSSISDC
jgi:Homeodomain-like domain